MNEPAFVEETLKWCNSIRARKGQPALERLPGGSRYDPETCPCGRATGLHVERTRYREARDIYFTWHDDIPVSVTQFIDAFDEGKLSQYEDKKPLIVEVDGSCFEC